MAIHYLHDIRRFVLKPLRKRTNSLRKGFREGFVMDWLARVRRPALSRTTFIGVTGSCGKSTTVAFADAFLSARGKCSAEVITDHRIGAQDLLHLDASAQFCIREVHAGARGVVTGQVKLLRPSIGAVTVIGTDHYTVYRSPEAVAREKGLLLEALPETGVAILNADDPHVIGMASRTRANLLTYGCDENADIRATDVSAVWPDRLSFTVSHGDERVRVETNLVGEFWITSLLAAMAIGTACGVDLASCASIARKIEPVFARYSSHVRSDGAAFVLDTYKAPVWTIASALAFVKAARAPRKTMIFGTLSDYGGKGGRRYRRVAREALEAADRVIFVGTRSGHVEGLRQDLPPDRLLTFQTTFQASDYLSRTISPGELVYVKGTFKEHLERIMLSQLDRVVCWEEWCARRTPCPECRNYRTPRQPPFGLGDADREAPPTRSTGSTQVT